jgi:hypothetical protein
VMLGRGFACDDCGTGATTLVSLQEARLCGFDEPD